MLIRTISTNFAIKGTYHVYLKDSLIIDTDDSRKALSRWIENHPEYVAVSDLPDGDSIRNKVIECAKFRMKHTKTKCAKKLLKIQQIQDLTPCLHLDYMVGAKVCAHLINKNILNIVL